MNTIFKYVKGYMCYLLVYRLFLRRKTPVVSSPENKPVIANYLVDRLAVHWSWHNNPISIQNEREIGGYMCWSNIPIAGASYSLPAPRPTFIRARVYVVTEKLGTRTVCVTGHRAAPATATVVATIHAHSSMSNGFDFGNFSETDLTGDNDDQIPGYLVTPRGALRRHDPNTLNPAIVPYIGNYFGAYANNSNQILLPNGSLYWDSRYDGLIGSCRRILDLIDIIDHIMLLAACLS